MVIVAIRNWRRLYVYIGNNINQSYPIAVGKPSTPTPLGVYRIINKAEDPGGPYGTRWMGLSISGYGIHGTNNNTSIGKSISMGCIRMYNSDIEYLFNSTPINTKVDIIKTHEDLPSGYEIPPGQPYRVKSGDTLAYIANRFNTTIESIVTYNHLHNTKNEIYAGQSLIIV